MCEKEAQYYKKIKKINLRSIINIKYNEGFGGNMMLKFKCQSIIKRVEVEVEVEVKICV